MSKNPIKGKREERRIAKLEKEGRIVKDVEIPKDALPANPDNQDHGGAYAVSKITLALTSPAVVWFHEQFQETALMTQQLDPNNPIPETYVFDGRMSRKGYALNKLGNSLLTEEARTAFKADEDAYMDQIGLTAEQKQLVRDRDWLGCVRAGANIYFLMKITMVLGDSLYKLGAKQKGMTYEEFLATRKVSGAT